MGEKKNRYTAYLCWIVILFWFFILAPVGFSAQAPPVGQTKQKTTDIPVGQTRARPVPEGGISADIFGDKGGRFHPFIVAETVYTDNLFATRNQIKNDMVTTIAPGLWLAFPANRARLLKITTNPTSPGGLKLSRIKPESTRRYQAYFLYSPELVLYSDHSTHNHFNHRAETLFQYNLNSGISFDLIDLYKYKEEIAGNGLVDTMYRYQDNLLDFITSYDAPSGKLKLQFTYSNYDINYDDTEVSYRNRNDNSLSISAFYRFWPKTALFLEYDHAIIDFDLGSGDDSTENRYFAGVTWDMTAKTKGTLKLGFTEKNFDIEAVDDKNGASVELQTQHNLSPKRALLINGFRKFNESDLANASSILSTGINAAVLQRFTEKWSGTFNVFYERNAYNSFKRDDDYYGFGPAVRFEPKKWMIFDMGFYFYKNNSTVATYDYEANQIFIRGTWSL